jgi:transposase
MPEDMITMRRRDIERLRIVHKVIDKELTQVEAGAFLDLCERQIRRLIKKVEEKGAKGLVHGNRGQPSPRKMTEAEEERIASVIRAGYPDFSPLLASEKLEEREGIKVSREKLRQIMLAKGLWRRRRKRREDHIWRERKHHFGEMVQVDGSHHEWLERRGPKLVFMGYVDDATGHVFGRFYDYEGVYPAMDSFCQYLRRYGLPQSLYLDKHSTYKTTRQPDGDELLRGEEAKTQFERALWELGVKIIHAHSPQAKGRVERIFGTLQNRLVKEMRLASVRTKEEANHFLETFLPLYNNRFSRAPLRPGNFHRPLSKTIILDDIFCWKGFRTINNGSIVKWRSRMFVLENASLGMRRQKVVVMEHLDGRLNLRFKDRDLTYKEITELKKEPQAKAVIVEVRRRGKCIPPPHHPWRRWDPSLHHNWSLERVI